MPAFGETCVCSIDWWLPGNPLNRNAVRPPPCNFHYLSDCKQGQNCRFSHGYLLSASQLIELSENARKWPCPYANRGESTSCYFIGTIL